MGPDKTPTTWAGPNLVEGKKNAVMLVNTVVARKRAVQPLAPTQSEPPFLIAQLVVMAIFIVLGVVAVKRFHG